jgi:cytidylate kinase
MIITISGRQGAGKTSAAKELAKKLNYRFISIGDLQGEVAKERGMTINELMELGKKDQKIHKKIDEKVIRIGKTQDNFIIEGWIAFHFIPHSKKIFLDVDGNVGAKRIFNEKRERPDEPKKTSVEETKKQLLKRLKDTNEAFKKHYKVNFLDKKSYDIVIDTTNLTVNRTVNKILGKLK